MAQKDKHQRLAAWVFGSIAFAVLVWIILFGPESLPPYRHKALGVFCSVLCGLFGYFFTGTILLNTGGQTPKLGRLAIRAGGGIAIFVFVLLWWNSNINPVKELKEIRADLAAMNALLADIQKRDKPSGELLAEFRRRIEADRFRGQAGHFDGELVVLVLEGLANDQQMTIDELHQKIRRAETGAMQRIQLVRQLPDASESDTRRLKLIERDAYDELASAAIAKKERSKAIEYYSHALALTSRAEEPIEWARIQADLGIALHDRAGFGSGPEEKVRLLDQSLTAYREALQVRTRQELPQDWAATQYTLGAALHDRAGFGIGPDEKVKLLDQAVTAYREALQVRTRQKSPRDWAAMQSNLGIALRDQARHSDGPDEKVKLLDQAITAYREALHVRTRQELPRDWAVTEYNLGIALHDRAGFGKGPDEKVKLLNQTITAYREALQVRTHQELPRDWAATQYDLGIALHDRAGFGSGPEEKIELLDQAVTAYREALRVRTRQELPLDWAATQYTLGAVLHDRAGFGSGPEEKIELLDQAVTAYRGALEVYTGTEFSSYRVSVTENLHRSESALNEARLQRSQ